MNYQEIKKIVAKIDKKLADSDRLGNIKDSIDERTDGGFVTIIFENKDIRVDAVEFKKLIDKTIENNDISADLVELKNKAK